MFRFANPQYLWLLVAIPLLVVLFWLAARSRRKESNASVTPRCSRS